MKGWDISLTFIRKADKLLRDCLLFFLRQAANLYLKLEKCAVEADVLLFGSELYAFGKSRFISVFKVQSVDWLDAKVLGYFRELSLSAANPFVALTARESRSFTSDKLLSDFFSAVMSYRSNPLSFLPFDWSGGEEGAKMNRLRN